MSFAVAGVECLEGGWFRIGRTRRVRLGGPDGPIARHVLHCSQPEWVLDGAALAESLRPEEWGAARVWLLWRAANEPPCRVSHISGASSVFSTDLIVQLELLEPGAGETWRPVGKLCGEALGLNGGRLTPKAKWTWTAPRMSIGSTTLG